MSKGAEECGQVHVADVHGRTSVRSTIVNYELVGLKCSKLAVLDEREGEDVFSIIPFDVTNEKEGSALKRAVEESKMEKEDNKVVVGEVTKISALTRSQAWARESESLNDDDVQTRELWCSVEPEDESREFHCGAPYPY